MILRSLNRITLGMALCLVISAAAFAQYGGTPGMGTSGGTTGGVYTPPKGGYKSSTGIAIGAAAAAGVGVAYLMLHNRKSVEGCLTESAGGTKLMDEKGNKTYALDSGDLNLKVGDRVKLKGKTMKSATGEPQFAARKLVKDYGPCASQAAMQHSPAS
ncbi:MAG: hypothetical protein KGM47_13620 [Acidobacteriota bacterium]|nr:hypothetical protein [Acidobacteriota bacterium]